MDVNYRLMSISEMVQFFGVYITAKYLEARGYDLRQALVLIHNSAKRTRKYLETKGYNPQQDLLLKRS